MFFGLIRRKRNIDTIEALYACINTASRTPALYRNFGVPDTLEGRFDSLTLHTILVMRRLRELPSPAPDVSQDLVDILFREIDRSLREIGIGDLSVPKKMKVFAKTFYGRAQLFDDALSVENDEDLKEVLARSLNDNTHALPQFAQYVRQLDASMATCNLDDILSGNILFSGASV